MYQKRLEEKINTNPILEWEDVNASWEKLKWNIKETAKEALGTRIQVNSKKPNKTPWFSQEVKNKCKKKKLAYLKYRSLKTDEAYEQYKQIRNETSALVRQTKDEYWEKFSKRMKSDFYGLQKQMWRFIRNQRNEIKELKESNPIKKETWTQYLTELYKKEEQIIELNTPEITTNEIIQIEEHHVEAALKKLKNSRGNSRCALKFQSLYR